MNLSDVPQGARNALELVVGKADPTHDRGCLCTKCMGRVERFLVHADAERAAGQAIIQLLGLGLW